MAILRATSQVRRLSRFFGIALGVLLVLTAVPGYGPGPLRNTASAAESPTRLPLSFVPNAGQTNPMVRFMAHSPAGRFFFTPTTVVLALTAPRLPDPPDPADPFAIPERPDPPSALRMRFLGARPETTLTGIHQLDGTANYLIGEDPEQWRSRLPTFAAIVYQSLYNGIDLRYEGGEGRLKSAYLVAAGADPSRIRWRYEGATHVQIDPTTGDLMITIPIAPQAGGGQHILREHAPVAWQVINGQQIMVTAGYAMAQNGSIGLNLGAFDASQPLIIDPTLAYSTYLGGSSFDWGQDIAMDNAGHVFVTGWTYSTDFPTEVPWQPDLIGSYYAYVTKLSIDGSALEFSTYLGSKAFDGGYSVALDRAGNVVVSGRTMSSDFPLAYSPFQPQLNGLSDAFVVRLSGDGASLLHGTFLGGSSHDQGLSVAVDQGQTGAIYLTGNTNSSNFPTVDAWDGSLGGFADAFVAKLSAKLDSLSYSTYLGGSSADCGYGIAVNDQGDAYIAGATQSNGFLPNPLYPFRGGPDDGFVIKLSSAGSPVYSTYLGGALHDHASGIAADSDGAVYVVGETISIDFPVANALQAAHAGASDAFLTKLNPAGSALTFSTYLGGSFYDDGFGVALDFVGNIYVAGRTYSTDFPLVDAMQSTIVGEDDAFVAKLTSDGSVLTYSTLLGGSNSDPPYTVAVDNACNAAITGFTLSQDYPISPNAVQPKPGGSYDAFVSKIGGDVDIWVDTTAISVTLQPGESITIPITIGNDGDETLCYSITKEEVSYPAQDATIEFPPYKVDPDLEDTLEEAPNGMADFLVYLTTQVDLSTAYEIEDWSERGWYVYDTLRDTAANTQEGVLAEMTDLLEVGHVTAYKPHFVVNAVSVTGDDDAVDTLALRTDVAHIALNAEPEPTWVDEEVVVAQTTAFAGIPWGVGHIGADQVWSDYGYTGEGVVVANMDTGVDYTHPGLLHQYRGYDPDTGQVNHDYNWYDPNLSSPCPSYPCDYGVGVAGHGTGTMGVIVGHEGDGRIYGNVDYNGQFINYTGAITTGVAPGAVWIATKVGGLNVADWLIAPCPIGVHPNPTSPDPRCDPDKRPHIVNFSFTGGSDVANRLRSAGILPAFSAGNDGYRPDDTSTPGDEGFCTLTTGAAEPSSFASGALRRINDEMCVNSTTCTWSSRGPGWLLVHPNQSVSYGVETNEIKPDVVAPGGWILSTALYESTTDCSTPGADDCDGYGTWAGTSFAAPHVAGATVLLLDALWSSDQADPTTYGETDISKLECLLTSTAIDMVDSGGNPRGGWPGPDYASGYGRIDVYEAARAVADSNFPLWLKFLGAAPGNPASMSGTVLPGQTSIVEIEISAVCPTTGAYQAQLVVNSNDPEQNPTILTVNLTVQNEPLPTCPYEPPTGW